MLKGVITKWVPERAFGFADNAAGGPSIFLHISSFAKFVQSEEIRPGMKIEFEIESQPGHKAKAINTRILEMVDPRRPADVKNERLKRQG
jgi:cold shock CspA family protein